MIDPGLIAAADLLKSGWEFSVYHRRRQHGKGTYVIIAMHEGHAIAVSADTLEAALSEAALQTVAVCRVEPAASSSAG